jgi:Flp pilus assembly protein TadD
LVAAISRLGDAVRERLARGSRSVLEELKATSWKPSTSSFEALRFYNEGLQFIQQGTYQEALKRFEAAAKQDPSFALAFSGMAQAYSELGYDTEAQRASRQAMTLGEALPAQEKHRIAANHYRILIDS